MKNIKPILLFLSLTYSSLIFSQELPPVQNFAPSDYRAENQNWGISQSEDRLIYIANNKGLLEYNGASWTLYPSPNETIVRSVKVVGSKIYTGAYMEFGYWQKNNFGELTYTSLSDSIDSNLLEDEEFWKIIDIEKYLIFQSLDRIYIYDSEIGSTRIIETENRIVHSYLLDGSIYFQRIGEGVFKIENGRDMLVSAAPAVKNNEVVAMFSDQKGINFVTRTEGVFSLINSELNTWDRPVNERLKTLSVYSAQQLESNDLIFGTIADGLIYSDFEGQSFSEFNQDNGLINNTVLAVFEDLDHNIWLALDNGVSFMNSNSLFKIYKDQDGSLGSVYASAIYNDVLYLGTNQGLFSKALESNEEPTFVAGTQGQVWNLQVVNNTLFCGHHKGTFSINDRSAQLVANVPGTWNFSAVENQPNLILQGNYDGIYVLEQQNGSWALKNKLNGFNNSARYFEFFEGTIFVNHEYKGIFKLAIDQGFQKITSVTIDTVLKGANSAILKYQEELLYAYNKGILKYDTVQNTFVKDSVLSNIYSPKNYVSGNMHKNEAGDQFWMFSKDNLTLVSPGELTATPTFKHIPLTSDERNEVVEFENIISNQRKDQYILGTSSGYITIDAAKTTQSRFNVYIDKIFNTNSKVQGTSELAIDKSRLGKFKSQQNNVSISFYTPKYTKFLTAQYQFQLLNRYDAWSDFTSDPVVYFENLPPGKYTFNVRSKIGNTLSTNVASYTFTIARPWYLTNLMLAVYGLMIVLFSIFMHQVYKRYYRKQQQKLIEKNKSELELARVQNEREIIKIRNEKLKKDYKLKTKELAASTMSMVKKNELLADIKERLNRASNGAVKEVIKQIDENLNHNDNWEFFKEAFDNADRDFFNNLKASHPNLTPNDMKLCAYLRLNLSSKEIAPLFNISARSVEIKRYRLRKKMDLSSNENLTNYILGL